MGIIKETDNITLNVYWKGWKKSTQRADYISKIRNIINRIDSSAQTSSQIDGCTFNRSIYNQLLLNILRVISQEYGHNL